VHQLDIKVLNIIDAQCNHEATIHVMAQKKYILCTYKSKLKCPSAYLALDQHFPQCVPGE